MKKLVIGLVVVALALAVVLGVQVGQGNKLRAEIEDQRAKVAALEPVSAEAEELKKQVTALTEEKEKSLQEAEATAKALTDERDALAAEAEAAKGKAAELEQQIKAAAGDKEKAKVLEKKLAQIEGQLSQKDNDTYRRQNAVIS